MKIYCVLVDSLPYSPRVLSYADSRNIKCLRQFAHCYTKSSTISLMTGKLPSELEKNGIGWKSHSKYRTYPVNTELDKEVVEWPWANSLITNRLLQNDWDIKIHNGNFFNQIITNNPLYEKTTSYEGGNVAEMKETWASRRANNFLFSDSEYYKNEEEYIKKIQSQKPEKNTFYYISLHQYHTALGGAANTSTAENYIYQILDYWDFEEEDCLFYFFSDHGNYNNCGRYPSLDIFYTWAYYRDNTSNPITFPHDVISICDFYDLCLAKMNSTGIPEYSKDRIYFMEDARANDNLFETTLFSASRVSKWDQNRPIEVEYAMIYKPNRDVRVFTCNLEGGTLKPGVPEAFVGTLRQKYEEILQ